MEPLENDIQKYPLETRKAALSEALGSLRRFAAKIRKAAVEKDRILRGNGFEFPAPHDRGTWQGSQPAEIEAAVASLDAIYCKPTISVDGVEMPFRDMLTDKVTFAKKNGAVVQKDIAASVQSKQIFVFDKNLPVEVGDHFLRQLPSGLVEDFVVDDPGFMAGVGGAIPPHFQAKVHRSDQPVAQPQTVINNITGHNARVNINSVDSSTNKVNINSSTLFAEMIKAVAAIQDLSDRELLTKHISEMAASHQRQDGSFLAKYQSFVAAAANHMTILAPFLPVLSKLI